MHPIPSCSCRIAKMIKKGNALFCRGCETAWTHDEKNGWEETAGRKKMGISIEKCPMPGCDGMPTEHHPAVRVYAMRCPVCGLTGPSEASLADAVKVWIKLVDATGAKPGEDCCVANGCASPSLFAEAVYETLKEMRDEYPDIPSCEEGAKYLNERLGDFWDWLRVVPSQRDGMIAATALVKLAATAQRVAEDRSLVDALDLTEVDDEDPTEE